MANERVSHEKREGNCRIVYFESPTLWNHEDCPVCRAEQAERERDEARVLAAVLAKWLHRECVMSGFDLDGGSVQEKLLSLGFAEMHLPEPGSPETEEFGQDQVLCYLKPEWAARAAAKGGGNEL
jgi:hypothetical protein